MLKSIIKSWMMVFKNQLLENWSLSRIILLFTGHLLLLCKIWAVIAPRHVFQFTVPIERWCFLSIKCGRHIAQFTLKSLLSRIHKNVYPQLDRENQFYILIKIWWPTMKINQTPLCHASRWRITAFRLAWENSFPWVRSADSFVAEGLCWLA